MQAPTDIFMTDVRGPGIQKGRGGFLRSANDTPYVSDPLGETCRSGSRKGEIKRLAYGSPSGAGRLIENDAGLVKFKQRLSFLGIGMTPTLIADCVTLAGMVPDSDEYRAHADHIAVEADRVTRSWLAADRGSHGHAITQRVDEGRGFEDLYEIGITLGLDRLTQDAVAAAWVKMLTDNGLEVVAIEASCVDDLWRLAGTLDRLVRTTKVLRFAMPDGTIVEVPAGIVLVLDIKFGQCRRAHLVQIASYQQSLPYDTDTETRGVWPFEIDATHALIAHGDFGGDGRPVTIDLVWADLTAGREHGGATVARAREWNSRDGMFSVSQLGSQGLADQSSEAVEVERRQDQPEPCNAAALTNITQIVPGPGSASPNVATTGPGTATGDGTEIPSPVAPSRWFQGHVNGVYTEMRDGKPWVLTDSPDDVIAAEGTLVVPDVTKSSARIPPDDSIQGTTTAQPSTRALGRLDRPAVVPPPPLVIDTDEGSTIGLDDAFEALQAEYQTLDDDSKVWMAALRAQAQRHGVDFHSHGHRTERRWWIIKSLVCLAAAGLAEDEVLRALLALVTDDEACLWPAIAPGYALGSLGARQARRLANAVDALVCERLEGYIGDDTVFRVRRKVAAGVG